MVTVVLTDQQAELVQALLENRLATMPVDAPAAGRRFLADLVDAVATSRQIAGQLDRRGALWHVMTAAEYAAEHDEKPATVAQHCRRGRLPARRSAGVWLIEVTP